VDGVSDDLHRAALNLIENALAHTPPGTPVTVSVRSEGSAAVLEVSDRGPGVPDELRGRVFERFARGGGDTGTAAGSGLGLAIVRAVADAHGGSVCLEEAEGGGARFTLRVPTATAPVETGTEQPVTR
ncbi:MAG: sensor histidine kinase, partial [Actinomycetota bacterium]|nr:sensor histidine kinase [Actinomycetota bacterium]